MRHFAMAVYVLSRATTAFAAPPASFDTRVEQLREQIGVPAMAVSFVEDGKVTPAKGFGVRAMGSAGPVDADAIIPTGSTGKAFTVADLGILVDECKIGWEDKVIDHLRDFQMYDSWVTREMTIRDLLVHRSGLGLGAGDLLFVPRTNLNRVESVRRLRYIKPARSFRSGFASDDILYMGVGQLIEAVTGETWEQFRRERILMPTGMLHSTGDNAAPAGGLAVSANDMARWLLIQLGAGKLPAGDRRLLSESVHEDMWKPVMLQPVDPRPEALKTTQPLFNTYALGWDV
jgi:CubicO group peptidase (beta-lactamase class C family)